MSGGTSRSRLQLKADPYFRNGKRHSVIQYNIIYYDAVGCDDMQEVLSSLNCLDCAEPVRPMASVLQQSCSRQTLNAGRLLMQADS
jgi:hypothetical protein